jgi:predicted dehydrogenase
VPAVTLIKSLVDEGVLGRVFHYRAKFLQDWTISSDLPQGGEGLWRLDVSVAGSGVTGDLLAHCIDTALWLNGPDRRSHRDDRDASSRSASTTVTARSSRSASTTRARSLPVPERIAGDLRSDALRARPQGAVHARDQRRARLGLLGPARPASHAVVRSSRRRQLRGWRTCTSPTATIHT